MDMSLDDIIKSGRKNRGGAAGGGGMRRGGGGGGGMGRNRGGNRSGAGGGGVAAANGGNNTRRRPTAPYKRGNVDGRWSHDMYDSGNNTNTSGAGGGGGGRRSGGSAAGGGGGGGGGGISSGLTKMMISNLDFGVTDADIQELFGEFGAVRNAVVHYDRSGRSLGTAHIMFERRIDAVRAVKQYGGVPLDGRAMKLELATSQLNSPSGITNNNNQQQQQLNNNNNNNNSSAYVRRSAGYRRGGGSVGGRGRRGVGGAGRGTGGATARPKQKTPTAAELDAELDDYINSAK